MNNESVFLWQDIFRSPAAKTAEIHPVQRHLSDGILRCGKAEKCSAIELQRAWGEASGNQSITLVLLLEGLTPAAMPGDKIVYSGETFEIAKVELCRSITGEIIARRCTIK